MKNKQPRKYKSYSFWAKHTYVLAEVDFGGLTNRGLMALPGTFKLHEQQFVFEVVSYAQRRAKDYPERKLYPKYSLMPVAAEKPRFNDLQAEAESDYREYGKYEFLSIDQVRFVRAVDKEEIEGLAQAAAKLHWPRRKISL